jgi:hypothetical protein
MFEKNLQVKYWKKYILSNKFGMLRIDSLNKEENIKAQNLLIYIYIYIYAHNFLIMLLSLKF